MEIPRDKGDFRLLDRRVVDTLVTMRERHRFLRGLSVWVGFRQQAVTYDRQERFTGRTKYPSPGWCVSRWTPSRASATFRCS